MSFRTAPQRWEQFGRALIELVNRDRRAAGLAEVVPDAEAMEFAETEARRLVEESVFSHYAADGSKPYQRWARRGGVAHVRENLYRLSAQGGRAYMLFEPEEAQARLMRSPDHRRNILDPAHTGVGIGVAYDSGRNSVVVVQEFVDRYVALAPGSFRRQPGETYELRGRVLRGAALEPWMAVLYREPEPGNAAAARASRGDSYREGSGEPVLVLGRRAFVFDHSSGEFSLRVGLPDALRPGSYTLFLYVASPERIRGGARRRSSAAGIPAAALVYEIASSG